MPLQIAYPEHKLSNGGSAWVHFDAKEIFGRDRMTRNFKDVLPVVQLNQHADDFAFKFLHARHRDIEEVARTAGGIEHLCLGELGMKRLDNLAGCVALILVNKPNCSRLN